MIRAFRMFAWMLVLTGVIYPVLITLIAQIMMPHASNGSLVIKEERVIGSSLIAQKTERDRYFWPRPSAIDYDPMKPSGGSNLGPTSIKLKEAVQARRTLLGENAPLELLFTSGSGLDPHISLETAYFQIPRIARERSIKEEELKAIVDSFTEGNQFGFLGPYYVNVLLLNGALDER